MAESEEEVITSTSECSLSELRADIQNVTIGDKEKTLVNPPLSDAVYRELSRLNGEINKMSKTAIIIRLKSNKLNTEGTCEVLKKRLKNFYRKKKLSKANLLAASKLYPYYVIIDFEATCQEINGPDFQHEIIEFPAVLVSTTEQTIVDVFHSYCKPALSPILSDFCTELTGISQGQVDSAETFPAVLENFQKWLRKHKLGIKYKFALVTDGPWDMGRFLVGQCMISGIQYPRYATKWINLRKVFSNFYKCKRFKLEVMLSHLGMEFVGRPHCGLDDSHNISYVMLRMMSDGAHFQYNERITWSKQVNASAQGKVVSMNPSEKFRDIKMVKRDRSKMDPSVFELSDTDCEEINIDTEVSDK